MYIRFKGFQMIEMNFFRILLILLYINEIWYQQNTLNCVDMFTLVFLQKYKDELSILKNVSVLKYCGF